MHYLDYNEKKQHGTGEFPLEYYSVDEHHPRYHMPFHWHKETELLYVRSGQIQLSLDGTSHLAGPGELIYISDGSIHGGEPFDCVYECLVFDPKQLLMQLPAIRHYLRKIERKELIVQQHFDASATELTSCAGDLFSLLRNPPSGWELLVLGKLFELYGLIFREGCFKVASTDPVNQGKIWQLKPVLEYIDNNYRFPISLEDLSRLAGMSPKYFCRFFSAIIHRTPIDYLNYYRIERACYLMETEDLTVTDAAYECGFNDSSYFVRIFKKYKGITPKQYMKTIYRP
ncbi:MAG: AraC family transcriptional regulator [Fusicatenibacter sp.]|nr:AraC family transcriptional regulator [Fusicatenibacter sp.]